MSFNVGDPKSTECELGAADIQEAVDDTQMQNEKILVPGDPDLIIFRFGSFNSIWQNSHSTSHQTVGTSFFFHSASPFCAYSCRRHWL